MKNLPLFLLGIAQVVIIHTMDFIPLYELQRTRPELVSVWYSLPKETIIQIVAYADVSTKENLVSVNKQLLDIVSKKNIKDMLSYFPCRLSRRDHLNCMVKYAKEDNKDMMLRLMKIAVYCDHIDWLDVIPYFLPKDAPELGLFEWDKDYENWSERLLSCIINVYAGDAAMIEQYKINHDKSNRDPFLLQLNCQLFPRNRDEVTALHFAVYHPVAIAQLLVSQDPSLINIKDNTSYYATPIIWAIRQRAVDVCKFLLSCKNIDLTQEQAEILVRFPNEHCSALYEACLQGSFELVKLFVDYNKKHQITELNSDYLLCRAAIAGRNKESVDFLLHSACLDRHQRFELIKKACYGSTPEILSLLLERFSDDLTHVPGKILVDWFYSACDWEQLDNARALLAKFAIDLNATQDQKFTSIIDGDSRIIGNITVLYKAAMRGDVKMIKFLLENDADPDIADSEGVKPIDVAVKDEIKQLLLQKMKFVTSVQCGNGK